MRQLILCVHHRHALENLKALRWKGERDLIVLILPKQNGGRRQLLVGRRGRWLADRTCSRIAGWSFHQSWGGLHTGLSTVPASEHDQQPLAIPIRNACVDDVFAGLN